MLAYRHLAGLGAVWQLAAEESTALAAGFSDLAAQLGAQDAGDPVAQVHAVLAVRPGNWLLIFDDAPGPAALQGVPPPAGRGQVLITSQNPHWPGRQAVDVPVLDEDVAAFLLTRTGSADRDAARQLAAELGGLPLALEQAAAFVLAAGRTMSDYLALFRQRRADLLARGQIAGYGKQVTTTWRLAFDQLQQTAPNAVALLRLLACCAPEQIPLRLLLNPSPGLSDSVPAELAPLLEDSLAVDDAVVSLREFSLVSRPQEGLVSIHRLVQAVTLTQLSEDQAAAWGQAAQVLIEAAVPTDARQPGTWPVYARLLPHAQATGGACGECRTQLLAHARGMRVLVAARECVPKPHQIRRSVLEQFLRFGPLQARRSADPCSTARVNRNDGCGSAVDGRLIQLAP